MGGVCSTVKRSSDGGTPKPNIPINLPLNHFRLKACMFSNINAVLFKVQFLKKLDLVQV